MSSGAGNRQDNRQRGNAAQLLEKYKGMARDAQMQGDRVQTEYFLQFADHYYRILNENRARFEEQRRQRGEGGYDASYDDEDQDEMEPASERNERDAPEPVEADEPRQAEGRREGREGREGRGPREGREPRDDRSGNGEFRSRRYRGRPSEEAEGYGEGDGGGSDERIAADILPPSIGPVGGDEGDEEPRAPRPRRPRRPRDEPGEEIAPAA